MNGFSSDAKKEIVSRLFPLSPCCRDAFCSAFVRSGGSLVLGSEGARLVLPPLFGAEKKALGALFTEYGLATESDVSGTRVFGNGLTGLMIRLRIFADDGDGAELLPGVDDGLVRRDCCAAAYLKGAFLGSGSVTLRSGYHLEFVLSSARAAEDVVRLMGRFGIQGRLVVRKDRHVAYVKGEEGVSDCLALMGAQSAVLRLNEEFALREFRRATNRRNNCDIANISKTVNAAVRQVEDIELLARTVGLSALPERLALVAKARVENPEDSFSSLAERLGLSKSTLKNRLAKLSSLADEHRPENA